MNAMQHPDTLHRLASMVSRAGQVSASLQDFEMVSDKVARVSVQLSHSKATQQECVAALRRALPGTSPVLASFRVVSGGAAPLLAGFVAHNVESIQASDPRAKRLTAVTASLLMDPEDESTWTVSETASGTPVFLRAGSEDMHPILASHMAHNVRPGNRLTASVAESVAGEFISFVSPESGELHHGFVLASYDGDEDEPYISVLTPESEEPVEVPEVAVVEALDAEGAVADEMQKAGVVTASAAFDAQDLASRKEYYRRVFAYAPDYVAQLVNMLDNAAAA